MKQNFGGLDSLGFMFGVALPSAACALLRPGERAAYGSLPRLWARLAMLLLLGVARPVASQCSNLCKFAFDSAWLACCILRCCTMTRDTT